MNGLWVVCPDEQETASRFSLELPASTVPEQLIPDLGGARIVSLNPLRGSLEDVFVEQVRGTGGERFAEKVAS